MAKRKEWWEKYVTPAERRAILRAAKHDDDCMCSVCDRAWTVLMNASIKVPH